MDSVMCVNNCCYYSETCDANRLQRFADMSSQELMEVLFPSERLEKHEVKRVFAQDLMQTEIAKSYRNVRTQSHI